MHSFEPSSPYEEKLTWNKLLTQTYQIYARRFWAIFRMGLPIGVVTYVMGQGLRLSVYRLLELGHWHPDFQTRMALGLAQGFLASGFYWVMSTIFLAAITANTAGETDSGENLPLLTDAYSTTRERLGSLIAVGCITWTAFFVVRGITFVSLGLALRPYAKHWDPAVLTLISLVAVLILGGLLSRVALAVPELMHNAHFSVREAFRASLRKTEGWEFFFMLFLAKSAIVGYAVYWLVEQGFAALWNRTAISASLYDWLTWGVYISLAAMLESPLFIALAVLDRETEPKKQEAWSAPAIG